MSTSANISFPGRSLVSFVAHVEFRAPPSDKLDHAPTKTAKIPLESIMKNSQGPIPKHRKRTGMEKITPRGLSFDKFCEEISKEFGVDFNPGNSDQWADPPIQQLSTTGLGCCFKSPKEGPDEGPNEGLGHFFISNNDSWEHALNCMHDDLAYAESNYMPFYLWDPKPVDEVVVPKCVKSAYGKHLASSA